MPYRLTAPSSSRDVWLWLTHPEQPALGPWLDAEGRRIPSRIADGDLAGLGFVPCYRKKGGGSRLGDLVWTTGDAAIIARTRFTEALRDLGVVGWRTYPVEVILSAPGGKLEPGMIGLAVDREGRSDVHADLFPVSRGPFYAFGVSDRVMEGLIQRGITGVDAVKLSAEELDKIAGS